MHFAKLVVVAILIASLAGCSGVSDTPVTVTPPASIDQIKAALNDIARSGELGSGGMTLEQEIEKIRATDAAKADVLKKGYDELKAAKDPASAKAKAQEMISKL
jgi:hypothetical protein